MNKFVFIILSGLICSCQPKTVEKNGGLIIDIDIINNTANEPEIDSALVIFKKRIENVCDYWVSFSNDNISKAT